MKIHQLDPTANMGQVGSSVLRVIQNNSDPLIDLFIRESIQNSLDAGDKESNIPYVNIDFVINEFDAKKLNGQLERITDTLNLNYTEERYKYIAVKDSNTTGLTGPLKGSEVRNNKYGNLQKLVYHVGKPQDEPGSGGSWGYGKTLYYRISQIGLVIYYSRIKRENGEYESRLCAVMCEDENSDDAILPPLGNNNKSGIAWWGEADESGNTWPITNDKSINEFLKIFGLTPYTSNDVGTIVIIPYINEQVLLKDIIEPNQDFEESITLEEAFDVAVQRWYAPRLDNPLYERFHNDPKVKYLKATINEKEITVDRMLPIFKCIQELYNCAIKRMDEEEVTDESINTEIIQYKQSNVGILAYTLRKKEDLSIDSRNPYAFLNIGSIVTDSNIGNIPIVCMTRQPGMVVAYNPSSWLTNLPLTQDEDYVIAFFVLNSKLKIQLSNYELKLEEYIRQSECADHLRWGDHSIKDYPHKIRCVEKIITDCRKVLHDKYSTKSENEETNTLSGLSVLLGKILAIQPSKRGTGGGHSQKEKKVKEDNGIKYSVGDDIIYSQTNLSFTIKAKSMSKTGITKAKLLLGTTVDTQFISCDKWETTTGILSPFAIEDYVVNNAIELEDNFAITLAKTNKHGETYGLVFSSRDKKKHMFSADLSITIKIKRKDLLPNVKF